MRNRPAAQRSSHRIVDDLNEEWRALVVSLPDAVPAWGRSHPALAGCRGLDDLVRRAARGEDAVLRPLLVEAHQGNGLAARVVLQAMLGRLVRMAGRDQHAVVDDYVGALWCVLVRYPLTTRPDRIAANLSLDTLKAVHRDRWRSGPGGGTVWLAGADLEPLLEQARQRALLDHAADLHELEAAAVIDAGHRLQLIDAGTCGLLRRVYVDGLTGREAAARTGTTAGSLRVRCSRAVRQLAAHASELVEAA
jgi:hypothetical protein